MPSLDHARDWEMGNLDVIRDARRIAKVIIAYIFTNTNYKAAAAAAAAANVDKEPHR